MIDETSLPAGARIAPKSTTGSNDAIVHPGAAAAGPLARPASATQADIIEIRNTFDMTVSFTPCILDASAST
ncbi:hypothetical protein [Burkholderia ubonensis]|uniref:hypothetical protein n=1 Tax=Burkholderia ubonensis TaxID=101571 RepID=UPI0012F7B44B|nr:hypothetical protein [Burkholderia ubonensis]